MSFPRVLFWTGLGILVLLWVGSVGAFLGGTGSRAAAVSAHSSRALGEVRELDAFRRITDDGSVDLEISVGGSQSVEVVADDDAQRNVEMSVSGGELTISSHEWSWGNSPKIKIVVPELEALSLRGSGDATVTGIRGSSIDLSTYGSGDIEASGEVDHLSFTSMGSGDASLSELAASDAVVRLHGSGDAHVNATRTLDVAIFGSGDVSYRGGARLTSQVQGSGDVTQE